MHSKKHSKLNNTITASFLLCKSTHRYEPEAKLMIFLHYEPARKFAEPHFGYSSWYPRKNSMMVPGMLQCSRRCPFLHIHQSQHFGLTQQAPAILLALMETPCNRNARLLEGLSQHFLNNREHFHTACSQTKLGMSASKKKKKSET